MRNNTVTILWECMPLVLLLLGPFVLLWLWGRIWNHRRNRMYAKIGGEFGLAAQGVAPGLRPPNVNVFFASPGSVRFESYCVGNGGTARLFLGDIAFKPGFGPVDAGTAVAAQAAIGAAVGAISVVANQAEHRTSCAVLEAAEPVTDVPAIVCPRRNTLGSVIKWGGLSERYRVETGGGDPAVPVDHVLPSTVCELLEKTSTPLDIQLEGKEVIVSPAMRLGFASERQVRFMLSVVRAWEAALTEPRKTS